MFLNIRILEIFAVPGSLDRSVGAQSFPPVFGRAKCALRIAGSGTGALLLQLCKQIRAHMAALSLAGAQNLKNKPEMPVGRQVKRRAQSFPLGKVQGKPVQEELAEDLSWTVMLQRAFVGNSEQPLSF